MEELLKKLIDEQQKTNDILMYGYAGKDPNELFRDPEFQAQRYMSPFRVTRQAVYNYMKTSHDYLCLGGKNK